MRSLLRKKDYKLRVTEEQKLLRKECKDTKLVSPNPEGKNNLFSFFRLVKFYKVTSRLAGAMGEDSSQVLMGGKQVQTI